MFRKISVIFAFVFAAFSLIASPTMAAVTFDSATGTGFVGKGDVQIAFGWNNKQLQGNASGVSFSYAAKDTYTVGCYWETETGQGKIVPHDIEIPRNIQVSSSVAYDARTMNQITGFNLTGFGNDYDAGSQVPEVGDACPGNNPGTVTDVTLTGSTGGLYVNYGENSVLLQ